MEVFCLRRKGYSILRSVSNSKYNLRNKDFSIPRVNTTKYGKHSIRYLGPYLWSKMNINFRQKASLIAFKDAIRGMKLRRIIGRELQL